MTGQSTDEWFDRSDQPAAHDRIGDIELVAIMVLGAPTALLVSPKRERRSAAGSRAAHKPGAHAHRGFFSIGGLGG
jgi:hypothetical protein